MGQVDVLILDITMPGVNGIDILKQIVSWETHSRVIFLSIHFERSYALQAIQEGDKPSVKPSDHSEREVDSLVDLVKIGMEYFQK